MDNDTLLFVSCPVQITWDWYLLSTKCIRPRDERRCPKAHRVPIFPYVKTHVGFMTFLPSFIIFQAGATVLEWSVDNKQTTLGFLLDLSSNALYFTANTSVSETENLDSPRAAAVAANFGLNGLRYYPTLCRGHFFGWGLHRFLRFQNGNVLRNFKTSNILILISWRYSNCLLITQQYGNLIPEAVRKG